MNSSEIPTSVVEMRPQILARARRNCRIDPEDLYNRVEFSCWRHRDKLSVANSPQAWVMKIVKREIANFCRRDRRHRSLLEKLSVTPRSLGSDVQDPFEKAARQEEAHLVREHVAQLPPKYRRVVEAVDFVGQSIKDFAKSSGLPHETCKTHHRRALKLLQKSLSPFLNPKGTTP